MLQTVLNYIVIGLTFLLFFNFVWRERKARFDENKRLKKISRLNTGETNSRLKAVDLDDDVRLWIADHLVFDYESDELVIENKKGKWLSKSPISQMLPSYDGSRYKLVPALLTSIGITGTFLGITLGLADFNMTGESKALLSSAAELLEGMKTAFYTSLAGLSLSAAFMLIMKYSASKLVIKQNEFLAEIAKHYLEASPVMYLKDMSKDNQQELIDAQLRSSQAMETLSENMSVSVELLASLGQSLDAELMAKQIGGAVSSSINEQVTPSLVGIKQELTTLGHSLDGEVMAKQIGGVVSTSINEKVTPGLVGIKQELTNLGHSLDGEVMAKQIGGVVSSSINEQVTPSLVGIKQELVKLNEAKQQDQQELIAVMMAEMKTQLIEPLVTELEKTANAVENSNSVSEQLNVNVEKVLSSTAKTLDTIDHFQQETMLKLQSFAEVLKDILTSFKDDTQGAMTTIATEVKAMLNQAEQGMDKQRSAFELSAAQASGAFESIKNAMAAALLERQDIEKQLFDDLTKRITGLLDEMSQSFDSQTAVIANTGKAATTMMNQAQHDFEKSVETRREGEKHLFTEMETRISGLLTESQDVFQQQANTIKLVGEGAKDVMSSAKDELQQGLGDIDNKVKLMSSTVQQELESFREQYQQNLTSYFTQQNDLLEDSLGKQRDGLNGVVDNFRDVFESEYKTRHNLLEELSAQHEKLQQSAKTIEQVAKAIGLNEASKMAELQDAAQTMGREIGQLKLEYSKAAASFNDVTENLPKAMDDYFSRANQSFEGFFNDFDSAASSIHNKLSQAAGYLINSQVQRRQFEEDEREAQGAEA